MDTTSTKAKTMAELLPGLSGILSKESIQTLTAKKQPRSTIVQTLTAEKSAKPMTIAEMRIFALKVQSPKRFAQGNTSTKKKKIWNSSVKVDKTISHTANGQMKHNPAKKMLNFQPKPAASKSRTTMVAETPMFPRPEMKVKKSLALQGTNNIRNLTQKNLARNNVRISGINLIPETPLLPKPLKSRMTLANKENISKQVSIKKIATPRPATQKRTIPRVPDTPLSNESWQSSCDASFLQKEKEINDVEDKTKVIADERTLENIAEVTPPISTPFTEYRSVQEYFNNSAIENSAIYHDNTIMSFEKSAESKEPSKREESVIVSLCDLIDKVKMNTSEKMSNELDDLFKIEQQTQHNIKMIERSICELSNIKESHLKSLQYVRKLIGEKKVQEKNNKTLINTTRPPQDQTKDTQDHTKDTPKVIKTEKISPEKSKPCSVIKMCSKSPSYKIPKKNLCLRKKIICKSMPNVSTDMSTPIKSDMGNRALSVYMKMKEHMHFLNTPRAKPRHIDMPDTPAVTSHNLQQQLDKLYGEQ